MLKIYNGVKGVTREKSELAKQRFLCRFCLYQMNLKEQVILKV